MIWIVVEGQSEQIYLRKIQNYLNKKDDCILNILENIPSNTPKSLSKQIQKKYNKYSDDSYFIIEDIDCRFRNYQEFLEHISNPKYKCVISNPCFEIFLLAFFKPDNYTKYMSAIDDACIHGNRKNLKLLLGNEWIDKTLTDEEIESNFKNSINVLSSNGLIIKIKDLFKTKGTNFDEFIEILFRDKK